MKPKRAVRRRTIGLAIGAVLLGAVGVTAARLPGCMITDARRDHELCLRAIRKASAGDPARCRVDGLWLSRRLPWSSDDATQLVRRTELDSAHLALQLARADLDRGARDRAAAAFVEAARSSPVEQHDWVGYQLRRHGAATAAVDWGGEAGLRAALDLGDVEAARRIAAVALSEVDDEHLRGRVLCALGDRDAGLRALAGADRADDVDLITLTRAACGGPITPGRVPPRLSCAHRLVSPSVPCGSLDDASATLLALVELHRQGERDPARHVELIDARLIPPYARRREGWSRWSLLADLRGPDAWPSWPADARAAAAALEAMATGDSAADGGLAGHRTRRAADAAGDVAPSLRYGAWYLEVSAATDLALRGRLTEAREAAQAARRLATSAATTGLGIGSTAYASFWVRSQTAMVLDLVGDADGARAVLRDYLDDDESGRVPGHVNEVRDIALADAMLLAGAGRFDEAWKQLPTDPDPRTDWLRAALAVRLNHKLDLPPGELGAWWQAATGTEPQRRGQRWSTRDRLDLADLYRLDAVLPAVLYLLGAAAGDGDRELWLDSLSPDLAIPERTRWMAARAEAARWAGDPTAAATWDHRLAALHTLATDDRAAYLLELLDEP